MRKLEKTKTRGIKIDRVNERKSWLTIDKFLLPVKRNQNIN